MNSLRALFAVVAALIVVAALACTKEVVKEVPVEVVVEKEVVKEVMVPGETIVVEKEVVKEVKVEVPGETVVVEKEVVKEVMVPGETVVVEKEVVKEVEVEVVVEKEVVKEVKVPGETVVVEKEVVKEVEVEVVVEKEVVKEVKVPGETVVVEKEVIKEVEVVKEVVVQVPEGPEEGVINLRMSSMVLKFAPYTAVSGAVSAVGNYVFSHMVFADPHNYEYIPDLPERWEISPSGDSYTFFLRKNATWHDGTPVTAHDVEFTFQTYINPDSLVRVPKSLEMVKGARAVIEGEADSTTGITVIDDHTIKFDMEFPTGVFLNALYLKPVLPKHVLGELAMNEIDGDKFFVDGMMGSGPYTFVQHQPDNFLEFEANPDYYFGRPKVDRVFMHVIPSPDATQIAMQRGEIDVSRRGGLSIEGYKAFIQDPRFVVNAVAAQMTNAGYGFNLRNPWFQDRRVRHAWLMAIDRRKLVDTYANGLGNIYNSTLHLPPGSHSPEMDALYPYDPKAARALLEEAGWDFDRVVEVQIGVVSDPARRAQYAVEQQMLAEAGFKTNYAEYESAVSIERWYTNPRTAEEGGVDVVRGGGWGGSVLNSRYYYDSTGPDPHGYTTPEMDALFDKAPRALSTAEMEEIGLAINEMLVRDLPVAPLWSGARLFTYASKVYVPGFGDRPQPSSLREIDIMPIMMWNANWFYHIEQWDVRGN